MLRTGTTATDLARDLAMPRWSGDGRAADVVDLRKFRVLVVLGARYVL
jgi:hypothetical protein